MKRILLATMTGLCIIAGCKHGKQSTSLKNVATNPSHLNGTWQLNYISTSGATVDGLYPGKKPKIIFDAAALRVSGNTGCNSFAGTFTLRSDHMKFDQPLITTKMYCPGVDENAFLETLTKIESWTVKEEMTLELQSGTQTLMRFTKVQ